MVEIASRTCKSQTTHTVVSIFRLFMKQSTQSTLKLSIVICFLLFFTYYFFFMLAKALEMKLAEQVRCTRHIYMRQRERERAREKKGAFFLAKIVHIVRACMCVVCVCGAVVVTILVIVRSRISITQVYLYSLYDALFNSILRAEMRAFQM